MPDALLRDLRHAARGLAARPAYAVVSMATLALVIGAASAVLAVVSATLVRPLPFPHEDRLVQLFMMPPGDDAWTSRNPQSLGSFFRLRQHLRLAEAVEGTWVRERALGGDDGNPETVIAGAVSPGAFAIFGGVPARGRTFTDEEDRADVKLVVLGHAIWQRRFGGDPAVIGTTVAIDREPHEVIGVMPPGFNAGFTPADLWTPLHATEAAVPSGTTFVQTVARLRPGVTIAQFNTELTTAMQALIAEVPKVWTGWSALGVGLRDAQFRLQRPSLLALFGGVMALVLIACANLANLTLAQILSRRPELALRAALGGSRGGLVRLQLIETLLLAAGGAAAGLLIGRWMLPALLALDPSLARTFGDVQIDWRVQLATAALALLVVVASGAAPMLSSLAADPARGLADLSRRTIGSRRDQRVRGWLVGAECALAMVLLASGAVLLSAFDRSSRIQPGFDPHAIFAAQLRPSATAYPTEAARADLIARVLDRIRGVPGVVSAAATLNRFVPGFYYVTAIHIEGQPTPDGQAHTPQFRRASPGYFETMRIPLLRGRDFTAADGVDQPWVAVVSRQFAERHWPGQDPIGRRIRRGTNPRWLTVIGVAGDVSDVGLADPPEPTVYITFDQNNVAITPVSLVVRTTGDPLALTGAIRAAVLAVDPAQPIDSITTVEQFLVDSLGPQRFRTTLLLLLGGIGLALAGLGIYGVTSRAVAERTAELGVRLALGATAPALARLVVWQAMRAVVAGLAVGALLTAVAVSAMFRLLPDLDLAQSWTMVPAALALASVATVSAVIPALGALSLSPLAALRAE